MDFMSFVNQINLLVISCKCHSCQWFVLQDKNKTILKYKKMKTTQSTMLIFFNALTFSM